MVQCAPNGTRTRKPGLAILKPGADLIGHFGHRRNVENLWTFSWTPGLIAACTSIGLTLPTFAPRPGLTSATFAPGLGAYQQRAPGLGSSLSHLRPGGPGLTPCDISAGTGRTRC